MADTEIRIRCPRCNEQMDLRDPAPGDAWKPDQFWVCQQCGRHFWSTYPAATKAEKPAEKPAAPATTA